MGDSRPFKGPSTRVGKAMMHSPSTKGRSSGNTSMGSAAARDFQTRYAMKNRAPSPASPLAMPIISLHNGNISAYNERRI